MATVDSVIADCIEQYPASHYIIAFSGGLDSAVLLHAFAQSVNVENITAIHVHHGLCDEADTWATHCESVSKGLGVACKVHKVNLQLQSGDSVEEVARNARYSIFQQALHAGDVLLTAHHADDQAETFMLNALRGSGMAGLSAMPVAKAMGQALHCRPLLSLFRQQLSDYAAKHKLSWVEDPSNRDDRFDRNYLRKHIMPLLRARWPKMAATLSRSANLAADNLDLLADLAVLDTNIKQGQAEPLASHILQDLSQSRRLNSLRYWLKQYGVQASKSVLLQVDSALFAEIDANPEVVIGDFIVRRYQGTLYCLKALDSNLEKSYNWDITQPLLIDAAINIKPEDLGELLAPLLAEKATLQIRFRQGGERLVLPGREHQHQVKKLLQERSVPPWLRDQLPMVYYQDRLIAILGLSPPILCKL